MEIKSLLIQGGPNRSTSEKIADGFTYLGRAYFMNRSITLIKKNQGENTLSVKKNKPFISYASNSWKDSNKNGEILYLIATIGKILFVITLIPVGVTMAIGLSIKIITLSVDKKAKHYNTLAHSYLKLDVKLEIKEKMKLQRMEKRERDIKNEILDSEIKELKSKKAIAYSLYTQDSSSFGLTGLK